MKKALREVIAGSKWLFLANSLTSLLNFLFWIVVVKFLGTQYVGFVSVIISSVFLSASLSVSGLNVAVIREVAEKGRTILPLILIITILLTGPLLLVLLTLVSIVTNYQLYFYISVILAIFYLFNLSLSSTLVGLKQFKKYFEVSILSAFIKLYCLLTMVFILDIKTLIVPLMSILLYYIFYDIITLLFLIKDNYISYSDIIFKDFSRYILNFLKLVYSNYPYIISFHIVISLIVYLSAIIFKVYLRVGIVYIFISIMTILLSVPNSLLGACLPVAIEENCDPFIHSLKIGLVMVTPLIVSSFKLSNYILSLIDKELTKYLTSFNILLISILPFVCSNALLLKLNKDKDLKGITIIGTLRISLTIIFGLLLGKLLGITGIALAMLVSNTTTLLVSYRYFREGIFNILKIWFIHISLLLISSILSVFNNIVSGLLLACLSIILMFIFRVISVKEIKFLVRLLYES